MAYARRTKAPARKKASPKRGRATARPAARRTRARSGAKGSAGRARSGPSTIRIQLVQSPQQDLSPVTQALLAMGKVTPPPRKAKF